MENKLTGNLTGRFFLGFVLILLGALFLAQNLDMIYIHHVGRYWPALFILFGAVKLYENDRNSQRGSGLGWIFLGSWLLVSMNGFLGLDFHNSWPILIIGWGASMLWKGLYHQPELKTAEEQHHGN